MPHTHTHTYTHTVLGTRPTPTFRTIQAAPSFTTPPSTDKGTHTHTHTHTHLPVNKNTPPPSPSPLRETVSLLLKCGASTTITDSSGSCPLHLAAWKGDGEIVRLLVTQGPSRANVNQQSDSDDTALHLASQFGYSNVVEFLLQVRQAFGEDTHVLRSCTMYTHHYTCLFIHVHVLL